ncbi:MAG: type II toxin-antitoxin system VapC family toxin [Deltaproteobacteria bacterium]|nr:type II toxin-antitoxin system VapC family toxin [Deltaproteobacteria bacterium]MBW1818124.1 type II toxin-antitoxin system VapC family toxin [Deltaproteobacteria bacterium]
MIVVDTNIIGYLFLSSERSLLAERALNMDSEWAAPLIWRSEMRNVLALYMRKNIIKLEHAQRIMDGALELVKGREYEVASYDVLRLASESTCSAYDCEFIAVANDLEVPLVTSDKKILRDFPKRAVSLSAFCD